MRSYTRWTQRGGTYRADWVGSSYQVSATTTTGTVILTTADGISHELDADTARMIAVRLIEGAALADVDAVRVLPDAR